MKHAKAVAILTLLLSGCAFHQTPYVTYDSSPALSQTSVFAAFDDNMPGAHATILAVDNKPTSCAQAGCPAWVRVLPGQHSFSLKYDAHFGLNGPMYTWKSGNTNVMVPAMKASHVYQAHYREIGDKVSIVVEDLGEKPKFGITLGLEGANKKYYPVEF